MSKSLQKLICNLIAFIMAFTAIFSSSVLTTFAANSSKAAADLTGTIWTIGDSTVCYYDKTNENSEKYNYRQGWGMRLGDYFNSDAKIENIARSGRSSRDFINYTVGKDDPKYGQYGAKWYDYFKENLKPGDYVFIQLNHNDQKEPLSYSNNEFVVNGNYGKTDADGGISTAAGLPGWQDSTDGYVAVEGLPKVAGTCTADGKLPSYEWFLYNYYVKVALDKGAYPVLVTPIVRGSGSKVDGFYPNVTGSDTSHTKVNWKPFTNNIESLKDLLGKMDYVQAVKDVAAYANSQQSDYVVPVIDLYAKSGTYWKNYADAHNGSVNDLHANDKGVPGHKDRTHLSREGAFAAAGLVVEGIKEQNLPIAAYLKDTLPDKPGDDNDTEESSSEQTTSSETPAETTTSSSETPAETTTSSSETPVETTTSSSETPVETTTNSVPSGNDKLGDFDLDGKVGADDSANVLAYVLNKAQESFKDYTERNLKVADVDGDGIITAKDASQILQKALKGGNFDFPVEVTTSSEKPVETTTNSSETPVETTTSSETPVETTTSSQGGNTPSSDIQDKIYEGFDVVVDARANSDADRANQPIFKTVNEAINYAKEQDPQSEVERIVIGIVPGTYREQILINTPYLTLKRIDDSTSKETEAKLTWYYGIGTLYYSVGANGYYDPARKDAKDYLKQGNTEYATSVAKWGVATYLQSGAKDFVAENIYFENSYNVYVTQEELDDGAKPARHKTPEYTDGGGDVPSRQELAVGSEVVKAKSYRERCAGLAIDADRVTLKGCTVIGTQDSLYIGGGRSYFENCIIEGNTDYIFGDGQAVFNNSELRIGGDPNGDSATFTAMKNEAVQKGVLFYNCEMTTRSDVISTAKGSSFGRPWGADADVAYINTKINNSTADPAQSIISDAGWSSMGSNSPADANFAEYNSVGPDGSPVDVSKRAVPLLNEYTVLEYNPYEYTREKANTNNTISDDWDPANLKANYDGIKSDLADVELGLTDNTATEDFALPTPVAGYEYYWVSSNENYAAVDNTTSKVTVNRPIWSTGDQTITLTAYMKKVGTINGIKKEFEFIVKAAEKSNDTFDLNGAISLSDAPEADLTVNIKIQTTGGVEVYKQDIVVAAGSKTVEYAAEGLTPSEYDMIVTLSDEENYAVKNGYIKTFTGAKGDKITQNIDIGKLKDVKGSTSAVPTMVSSVDGYSVTSVAEESVAAYNFNKATGIGKGGVYYWDLASAMEAAGNDIEAFKTADKITINFKVKYPELTKSNDVMTYFDIVGNGDPSSFSYADETNDKRYVRFRVGGSWQQMDALSSIADKWSGSSNNEKQILNFVKKFTSGNAADVWSDVQVVIDFKNGTVTPSGINNNKGLSFAMPENIDRSKLYFVIYPQTSDQFADDFFISNVDVSYKAFADASN